jgi:hypothetical protein
MICRDIEVLSISEEFLGLEKIKKNKRKNSYPWLDFVHFEMRRLFMVLINISVFKKKIQNDIAHKLVVSDPLN